MSKTQEQLEKDLREVEFMCYCALKQLVENNIKISQNKWNWMKQYEASHNIDGIA